VIELQTVVVVPLGADDEGLGRDEIVEELLRRRLSDLAEVWGDHFFRLKLGSGLPPFLDSSSCHGDRVSVVVKAVLGVTGDVEQIGNLVLESDENGAESRSGIHERSVRSPGEASSRVNIAVDSFGIAAGSVSPEVAFLIAVVKTAENIEMFSISDGSHFFEGDWKADSLNPGSESSVGSVVLAVLGEELDVWMVVVGDDVAVVAESSAAHDDGVSLVVLHCCLDVGESQPWLALPNYHIGRTPASAILVVHAVVDLVSRVCWRAHDRSFLISLSRKTLLEASAGVLLHRVRKFLGDTVHDDVEPARSF